MVARVSLEGLPPYAVQGGAIEGTFVLVTDRPLRAADLDLTLRGREISQATTGAGKSLRVNQDDHAFFESTTSFREDVPYQDPEHVAPGTYRLPFRFNLPPTAEPSLATDDADAVRGPFFSYPDGMFVEYELDARVRVPWWADPIDRVTVPVIARQRVLGTIPSLASPASEDHPSFKIDFDPDPVVPGGKVAGSYVLQNPKGKHLEQLSISFLRRVEYHVLDLSRTHDGPTYDTEIPIVDRDTFHSGQFQIPLASTVDETGPYEGHLFRSFWMVRAELGVEFGFNVKAETRLTPPAPPLPDAPR